MGNRTRLTRTRADVAAIRWLLERDSLMTEEHARWIVARTHVIDCYPTWPDDEVDAEVARRMAGEGRMPWEDRPSGQVTSGSR